MFCEYPTLVGAVLPPSFEEWVGSEMVEMTDGCCCCRFHDSLILFHHHHLRCCQYSQPPPRKWGDVVPNTTPRSHVSSLVLFDVQDCHCYNSCYHSRCDCDCIAFLLAIEPTPLVIAMYPIIVALHAPCSAVVLHTWIVAVVGGE